MSGAIYKSNPDRMLMCRQGLFGCIWLSGLCIGVVLVAVLADELSFLSPGLYPILFLNSVKFLFSFLPFLLSALAVYFLHGRCLFWICGLKAIFFSSCCCLLCKYHGQAGWLACCLFMFFDVCSLPLLFYYWLSTSCANRGKFWRRLALFILILIGIFIIDYRFVTPYAVKFRII